MEDFIRVWPNFVSREICGETIDAFEYVVSNPDFKNDIMNSRSQFSNGNMSRDDLSIFLDNVKFGKAELASKYLFILQHCITEYLEDFSQLKSIALTNYKSLKIQRTMPMGGFHHWHYEQAADVASYAREVTWMIYLNDMPPGEAETEFLFQHKKLQPTCGTVVMWPAGMTHVHRGLTVYTHPKYIATGWYSKDPPK
jgi:hypothetical protein